ncbi:MAG TPA: gluconate 2-dehydrogenase subunit 3 family protein, partial [Hyphomicrobiales bacterium]|nr:gluconate 2-dehydrogenase subunit 3 family protein [Hyphomicrobiales bacterium]
YLDHSLAEWNQADLPLLRDAIAVLDAQARAQESTAFASLPAEAQDALLMRMEAGQFPSGAGQAGFNRLLRLTLEGMFSDPYYGGNRNYAGWDLIGYPGAVLASTQDMQAMGARLPPLHTSAYGAAHDGH